LEREEGREMIDVSRRVEVEYGIEGNCGLGICLGLIRYLGE